MKKTKEELLATFKKANKVRRLNMALNAGYENAEDYFNYLTGLRGSLRKKKPVKEEQKGLDMVIAFDSTGSMSRYIDAVRKHVEKVVNEMLDNVKNLRIKIVVFGDYFDMDDKNNFGTAYQSIELTDDRNKLIEFIQNAKNTCGGDGDEFYELVIKKIVEETDWRKSAKKSILLIGDAEPHEIGYSFNDIINNNRIDWRKECNKARDLEIQIDTLRIYDHITFYEEVSKITGGVCMEFKNSEKISNVITGLSYVRGDRKSFDAAYKVTMDSGDTELIGAYKSMSTLL